MKENLRPCLALSLKADRPISEVEQKANPWLAYKQEMMRHRVPDQTCNLVQAGEQEVPLTMLDWLLRQVHSAYGLLRLPLADHLDAPFRSSIELHLDRKTVPLDPPPCQPMDNKDHHPFCRSLITRSQGPSRVPLHQLRRCRTHPRFLRSIGRDRHERRQRDERRRQDKAKREGRTPRVRARMAIGVHPIGWLETSE